MSKETIKWIKGLNEGQPAGTLHKSDDSSNRISYSPGYHSDNIQIGGNYSADELMALGRHMKKHQEK